MKVSELFEEQIVCQPGRAIKNKHGTWTACNHKGDVQEFDSEGSATQYASTGANDIADE